MISQAPPCQFCGQLTFQPTRTYRVCEYCHVYYDLSIHENIIRVHFPVLEGCRLTADLQDNRLILMKSNKVMAILDYVPAGLSPDTNAQWIDKLLGLMVFS